MKERYEMYWKVFVAMIAAVVLVTGCAAADGIHGYGAVLISGNDYPEVSENKVIPLSYTVQNSENLFYKALDGQPGTVYSYTAWNSKTTDDIPEVELTFNRVTLTDLWIRNGDQTDPVRYYENARVKRLEIVIWSGRKNTRYEYLLSDIYDMDTVADDWIDGYQRVAFPKPVRNVTKVELWIKGWYTGSQSAYNVSISDMMFAGGRAGYAGSGNTDAYEDGICVRLNQRLATRSGPGTQYNGLGSYFSAGTMLKALSASFDTRNGIWWIQVEFDYGSEKRRAYTGLKRLDMEAEDVRTEQPVWTDVRLERAEHGLYGPGPEYTKYSYLIPAGTTGTVYSIEGDYAQLEYYDSGENVWKRVWVPLASLSLG